MRSLPVATDSRRPKAASSARVQSHVGGHVGRCSAKLLADVPPVMWFIRRQVALHRAKGLSISQYRVLCIVSRGGGESLSDVAENLGIGLPMVSKLVTRLVARGLLVREEAEGDRRRRRLVLSAKGKKYVDSSHEAIRAGISEKLSGLTREECDRVIEAMSILERVFGPNQIEGLADEPSVGGAGES